MGQEGQPRGRPVMHLCHRRLRGWVLAWTGEAHIPLSMVRGWDRMVCGGLGTSLSVHGPNGFLSIAPTFTEEHGEGGRLS